MCSSDLASWLHPVFKEGLEIMGREEEAFRLFGIDGALIGASVAVAVIGMLAAWRLFGVGIWFVKGTPRPETVRRLAGRVPFLYRASLNKWWFDELNDLLFIRLGGRVAAFLWWFDRNIVDGVVNGIGSVTGSAGRGLAGIQTGRVQNYALGITIGLIVMIASYVMIVGQGA